jgi:hypothetical protein
MARVVVTEATQGKRAHCLGANALRQAQNGLLCRSSRAAAWWIAAMFACGYACTPATRHADGVYTVRGRVIEVSGRGEDARVVVAHEAIANFIGRDARPGHMPAMRMAFGIGPKLRADSLVPNSQWALTFEVRWRREPVLLLISVEPLPKDLALALDDRAR